MGNAKPFLVGWMGLAIAAQALLGCAEENLSPKICEPSTFECTDDGARTCNLDGTVWVETPCEEGTQCIPGDCPEGELCEDACEPLVCVPNSTVCDADNIFVLQCDAQGTGYCYSHSCVEPPLDGFCYRGECVATCDEGQKSYLGCEYFAVDLDNAEVICGQDIYGDPVYCDASNSQFAVVVSNPDPENAAFVRISKGELGLTLDLADECAVPEPPANFVDSTVIPPKGVHIFELPSRNVNGTVIAQKAYRIASNIPLTVYQFNPLENVDVYSNDASVLLPTTTAGTEFWVMTREQTFDLLKGYLTVVGVQDEPTTVQVRVTSRTLPGVDETNDSASIPKLYPGETFTAVLEKYEVLNIETNFIGGDLTGSHILADKGVLVYAGSEASNAPNTSRCDLQTMTCEYDSERACGCPPGAGPDCSPHEACAVSELITCCADHLEQQLFPVDTWGSGYFAVRSMRRGNEKDLWRVLASQDDTLITTVPEIVAPRTLDAGDWFEFEADVDFELSGSRPVLLGQFLAAEHAPNPGKQDGDAKTGDPAFILSVPTRQYRDSYVFLAPNKYLEDYVSIAFEAGSSVRLDGTAIEEIPGAEIAFHEGGRWGALRTAISDGYHTLSCERPCGVMVHGYDQYVSYGYPGGLNLDSDGELP